MRPLSILTALCVLATIPALTLPVLTIPAWAGPPPAEGQPLQRPARDVTVEYGVSGMNPSMGMGGMGGASSGAGRMTIHFANKGTLMRIEPPGGMGHTIMNADTGRMIAIMTPLRTYVEVTGGQAMIQRLSPPNTTFRKVGADTVAGLSCTLYATNGEGRRGHVCLTDDGVLLRARGGDAGSAQDMEALKVTYAPQPAALFQIPAGYQRMDMPNLGALGGMMGGSSAGGVPGGGVPVGGVPVGGVPGVPAVRSPGR